MKKRFLQTSSTITQILKDSLTGKSSAKTKAAADAAVRAFSSTFSKYAEAKSEEAVVGSKVGSKVGTSAAVADELEVWKVDVGRLLAEVGGHVGRCRKLQDRSGQDRSGQDHEAGGSHRAADMPETHETPADARRERINSVVLTLKADLRSLVGFLRVNALLEEHEVVIAERRNPLDHSDGKYPKHTRYYWRDEMEELERKLADVKPVYIEATKVDKKSQNSQNSQNSNSPASPHHSSPHQITAAQISSLWSLKQSLMAACTAEFSGAHAAAEAELDAGGGGGAAEGALRRGGAGGGGGRVVSGFVRALLEVKEAATELAEDSREMELGPEELKEGLREATATETYRRQVSEVQFRIRGAEEKMGAARAAKNSYKNLETRRGMLQRWRLKLDEYEVSIRGVAGRQKDLEEERDQLEAERARLHRQVAEIDGLANKAAEAHESKLLSMHPLLAGFEEEARGHKNALEGLLLDVNLTTGLFKKRECEVSAEETRLEKTRSTRAQIERERKKNELERAGLNTDGKRNLRILSVALAANEEITAVYKENRKKQARREGEIEEVEEKLAAAVKEREHYEENLAASGRQLEERKEKREALEAECRRVDSMLANVTEQVQDTKAKMSDSKVTKLKETVSALNDMDIRNKTLAYTMDKAKKKLGKLEAEDLGEFD